MRTFIAIELPPEIKEALAQLQEQLKASGADIKWVKPQNIHLTLKFLGDTNEKKIAPIMRILEETACNKPVFTIRVSSLGAFPGLNSIRVIWAGIDRGDAIACQIAKDLEGRIASIGIPKEKRPFSSHITIGRAKSGLNSDKLARDIEILGKALAGKNMEASVKKITLFKSTLTPGGPAYEALKAASLKNT